MLFWSRVRNRRLTTSTAGCWNPRVSIDGMSSESLGSYFRGTRTRHSGDDSSGPISPISSIELGSAHEFLGDRTGIVGNVRNDRKSVCRLPRGLSELDAVAGRRRGNMAQSAFAYLLCKPRRHPAVASTSRP